MDQREWGQLREAVVRRTQASGASREDAEDATHDALLAAIGQPEHARSQVAWLSTVAARRRVDLIRRRVREQRMPAAGPGTPDLTAAGPEDVVVERAHATWLAASLTQLPATTREVVDAVGSGMAPSEVARSMNLSARSVESHLTRARRHLRRMGALAVPVGFLLGWVLRARPGSRVVPAALAVAVPVVVTAVVLLPSSTPNQGHPGAASGMPGVASTGTEPLVPGPRSGSAAEMVVPGEVLPGTDFDVVSLFPATAPIDGAGGTEGAPGDAARPQEQPPRSLQPEERTLPHRCLVQLPLLGELGCVLSELVDGVTGSVTEVVTEVPLPAPLSVR